MIGPPAVIGATDIFIFELDKLLIAVEALALSEAAPPSEAWWSFCLSEGIWGGFTLLPESLNSKFPDSSRLLLASGIGGVGDCYDTMIPPAAFWTSFLS